MLMQVMSAEDDCMMSWRREQSDWGQTEIYITSHLIIRSPWQNEDLPSPPVSPFLSTSRAGSCTCQAQEPADLHESCQGHYRDSISLAWVMFHGAVKLHRLSAVKVRGWQRARLGDENGDGREEFFCFGFFGVRRNEEKDDGMVRDAGWMHGRHGLSD